MQTIHARSSMVERSAYIGMVGGSSPSGRTHKSVFCKIFLENFKEVFYVY